jgi:uncharacterized RDD family membrane protein YckC
MAFFGPQDFTNYFVLVGLAVVLTASSFVLVASPRFRATPGQYMLGLRLVSFSGQEPSPRQVLSRTALAVVRILLVMLPGPAIALLIGVAAASVLQVPFSTTDKLLVQAGVPQALRYALHSLSFIALIAALWVLCARPLLKYWEQSTRFLTPSDRLSHTTHVRSEA